MPPLALVWMPPNHVKAFQVDTSCLQLRHTAVDRVLHVDGDEYANSWLAFPRFIDLCVEDVTGRDAELVQKRVRNASLFRRIRQKLGLLSEERERPEALRLVFGKRLSDCVIEPRTKEPRVV